MSEGRKDPKLNRVWLPDDTEGYILCQVKDEDLDDPKAILVADPKGMLREVQRAHTYPANPDNLDGVPDNTQLMHLHEASLMHNLRHRFMNDQIYTFTAYILIAVNPYQRLPIYGEDIIRQYKGKSIGILEPHPYAIADRAYRSMKASRKSQSVIISGESGAGKTETSKIVMSYLAAVGGSLSGDEGTKMGVLENRIIACNPILESVGNAKTVRNDNSSRFGKFTKIDFERNSHVSGASIQTYLLEKSRLVFQADNERNYHVFYQMCAGATADEREKWGLQTADDYWYTKQGDSMTLNNVDDAEEYRTLRTSMTDLGFTADEQNSMFEVCAGVLHMGNVAFSTSKYSDGLLVKTPEELKQAAELLHVPVEELEKKLANKTISAGGKTYTSPVTEQQAVYARDALVKFVYSRLFDWIVGKINLSLSGAEAISFIGVLDIYGFEFFDNNSFEQFCINLANEKLQQHFNHQVLRQEQEIYQREGIIVPKIDFVDNQDCIDLIEDRRTGIFSILDEECRLPKPDSKNFCEKIHRTHNKHNRLMAPKPGKKSKVRLNRSEGFIIRHFAGDVTYTAEAFIDKNNDSLNQDLSDLVRLSVNADGSPSFVQSLFSKDAAPQKKNRKNKFESIGSKFSTQLGKLMSDLTETVSHFIRCVKPNSQQKPRTFEVLDSLNQLRCSGMLEALLLMHEGFPTRCPYEDLYERYKDIVPPILSSMDSASFCEALFMALEVDKAEFQLGITKVFFRAGRLAFLDELRGSEYSELTKDIAEKVMKWLAKKRMRRAIYSVKALNACNRRVAERRAFDKLAKVSLSVFILSTTLMKRARRLRRNFAARKIQALIRGRIQRKAYLATRAAAAKCQAVIRGFLCKVRYRPILTEMTSERKRRKKAEEEELKRLKGEERQLRLEAEKQRQELERSRLENREQQKKDEKKRKMEEEERMKEQEAMIKKLEQEAKAASSATAIAEAQQKLEMQIQAGIEKERKILEESAAKDREAMDQQREGLRDMEDKISMLQNQIALVNDPAEQERKNDEKNLRIEIRLRELERESKEMQKKLESEAEVRKELEKTVRSLQNTMKTQSSEVTKRLEEECNARTELEKIVYSLQITLSSAQRAPSAAQARRAGGNPRTPQRTFAPSPRQSPMRPARSRGGAGEADGKDGKEEKEVTDGKAPDDPLAALDAVRVLASASPSPPPMRNPKTTAPPEPIVRLRKAVEDIQKHFKHVTATNRSFLGDDCKNVDIGRLVRGQLCSALVRIFWHGFKSFRLIGRYHLWDFFARVQKELDEVDKNSQLSLSRAIEIVNNSHELVKNNDVKFRSLVCYGLNYKILHVWISLLGEEEAVVMRWFESWSFIRSPVIRAQIVATLQPLVEFPFCMSLDFEIAAWDL